MTAAAVEPVRRTAEIEDPTNIFFVHAISNRLTPALARLGIRPNSVSIAGMGCGIAAGIAYGQVPSRLAIIAGFVLMLAWHVLDGTDGQLARLTRKQSETGRVLDGICDYVTFAAVYLALTLRFAPAYGAAVWWLVLLSGVSHAMQSASYERQRQDYERWGRGRTGDAAPGGAAPAARPFRLLDAVYRRAQSLAVVSASDRARLDDLFRSDPADAAALRARYRAAFAGPVRRWSVLSANYRTIAIFAFSLAGAPLLFFVWEIVGLGAVLAFLALRQRARFAAFVAAERVGARHPGAVAA